MALTFYYGSGSPFAWKVWLTLEHKRIPYELKALSFDKGDTRSPAFLAVNPRGKVPTIVDDGLVLWESAAIVEYLEERYPEPCLLPRDVKARALARRIAAESESFLTPAVNELFRVTLFREGPEDADALAKAQARLMDELPRFEAQLSGDFFVGELSLADFTVYPQVRNIKRIEQRAPGKGLGDRIPARLEAWMKRIEALPYYAKTTPPHWKA